MGTQKILFYRKTQAEFWSIWWCRPNNLRGWGKKAPFSVQALHFKFIYLALWYEICHEFFYNDMMWRYYIVISYRIGLKTSPSQIIVWIAIIYFAIVIYTELELSLSIRHSYATCMHISCITNLTLEKVRNVCPFLNANKAVNCWENILIKRIFEKLRTMRRLCSETLR